MAEGLSRIVQAARPARLHSEVPADAEEYKYMLEGLDPQVQSFNGATEQKAKPNYSDYMAWREQRRTGGQRR